MTSRPEGLRVLLGIAAVGAVAVLLSFLGRLAEIAGVVAIVAAALLAQPSAGAPETGVRWHRLLGAGALICAVALPLSLLLDTIGGLLAGIGAALVIVAVAFGWPGPNGGASVRLRRNGGGHPPTGPPRTEGSTATPPAPHAP